MAEKITFRWVAEFWTTSLIAVVCSTSVEKFAVWLNPEPRWFVLAMEAIWRCSLAAFGTMAFVAFAAWAIKRVSG